MEVSILKSLVKKSCPIINGASEGSFPGLGQRKTDRASYSKRLDKELPIQLNGGQGLSRSRRAQKR